jgi:hypothetical protein
VKTPCPDLDADDDEPIAVGPDGHDIEAVYHRR